VLPDFACLGAIKSGTSELSTYLFQHPCIAVPLAKEVTSADPREWSLYYPTVREKKRVEAEHGKMLCGYFTPALHSYPIMDSYRRAMPNGKVILLLRNPVERAYSHYKWDLLIGGKRWLQHPSYRTFTSYVDTALHLFPAVRFPSLSGNNDLLQTGIYATAVEEWFQRFPRERVRILRAEDFFEDIAGTVCDLHRFLDLPPIAPQIHKVMNKNPLPAPPFEPETREKLRAFYRPWNEQLYVLLGRDMRWD